MRHLLNLNFSLYMTCFVELRVGRSNYPSHSFFCLLSCLSFKKKKFKSEKNWHLFSPPPFNVQASLLTSFNMAISATIII